MTAALVRDTLVLGAITGMRSMAGLAALAVGHHGRLPRVVTALAVGEMIADKTDLIGDRIDPFPLAGRVLIGALVGGIVARREGGPVGMAGLLGATCAVIAAYGAYHVRRQLPVSNVIGGLLEDGLVIGTAAFTCGAGRRRISLSEPTQVRSASSRSGCHPRLGVLMHDGR